MIFKIESVSQNSELLTLIYLMFLWKLLSQECIACFQAGEASM
jgi:hypothetical protein